MHLLPELLHVRVAVCLPSSCVSLCVPLRGGSVCRGVVAWPSCWHGCGPAASHACAHRLLLLAGALPLLFFFPATCRGVAVPRCWLIPGVISVSCGLRVCGLKLLHPRPLVSLQCAGQTPHSGLFACCVRRGGVMCASDSVHTHASPEHMQDQAQLSLRPFFQSPYYPAHLAPGEAHALCPSQSHG
jgi:hypothetical protein